MRGAIARAGAQGWFVSGLQFDPKTGKFHAGELTPAAPAEGEGSFSADGLTGPNAAYWARMFSGDNSKAAERLAAVYACANVISSSIAAMPLHLMRKNRKSRERVQEHPVARLLRTRPNAAMTWPAFRQTLIYRLLLRGNQYTRVFWERGNPRELFPLPENAVSVKLTDSRRVVYSISENAVKVPAGQFTRPEIAHFKALSEDGLTGINPISHCRITTEGAVAVARYGKTAAEQGSPIRGIITAETTFKNPDQAKLVRKNWSESYAAAAAGDGMAIFEGGDMKFHPVTMSLRDAQFIEQMQFSVEEICRIFNVPPHKVQKLDKATFNNIEHLSKEFYIGTLIPWINGIEAELNDCLLTERERADGYYLLHNADGLLRGDLASRSESYQKQISSSVMTPNEARALEDREPMEGGDELLFPINHARLSDIQEIEKKKTI